MMAGGVSPQKVVSISHVRSFGIPLNRVVTVHLLVLQAWCCTLALQVGRKVL